MIGDFITFKGAESNGKGGMLVGDSAAMRLGVQVPGDGTEHRKPLNFDDFAFRIVPMLNYRQRNELDFAMKEAAARSKATAAGKARRNSVGGDQAEAEALELLKNRVAGEARGNAETLAEVMQGMFPNTHVRYGDIVQLQHVKSGGFLSVLEAAAPIDPECRAVVIDPMGSASALFKFMPRFKAQTEGSIVYYTHTLVVESVQQREMRLHTSSLAYSNIPDPSNPALPKCLQKGRVLETNLSPKREVGMTVTKFARFGHAEAGLMRTGDPFRLYHSQSESFVQASCDAEKDRRNPQGREGGVPTHLPYLKQLPDLGEDPDPTDPKNHFPKGVWCFEPRSRGTSGTVDWDKPIRVRHVPSGRYLAVNTEAPLKEDSGVQLEVWFSCFLVDDEIMEEDELGGGEGSTLTTMTHDLAGNELGFKTIAPERMLFQASSADADMGTKIPNMDVNLRLSHVLHDGVGKTVLYLHNSEERKPHKSGSTEKMSVIARSFRLVFSTVRSAQDIFKVMRVKPEEAVAIANVAALMMPTALYTVALSDPRRPVKAESVTDMVALMLKLLNMTVKGDFEWPPGEDWMVKANSLLPAAFAALFAGEPDTFMQRIFRDIKVMDSVFGMCTAAYVRASPANPWAASRPDAADMLGPKAVQKFIHVALQRMCDGNSDNQAYFGKRAYTPPGTRASPPVPWMDTVLAQLEDPLGSAVTLSKLLSANDYLMQKYANASLVLRFVDMVRSLGPQPRLVNFFEAICTVEGRAVKANQEMVLRLTWMNEENRNKMFLSTKAFDPKTSTPTPALRPLSPVREPSGKLNDGKLPAGAAAKFPPKYLGKDVFEGEGSLHPIFVQWKCEDAWTSNVDALYWSPSALGIPVYDLGKDRRPEDAWVRVEDLCWVLAPERLCESITGRPWVELEPELKHDKKRMDMFKAQVQIADYYCGQLSLHARMCFGRSYNCIAWMEKSYTYEALCSLIYSPHLPSKVRAVATDLVRLLYLDRYPQMHSCGRPSLPEQLWVYDVVGADPKVDLTSVPQIKPLALSEDGALPEFKIGPSHKFYGDDNRFYGFPGHTKFFLLRNFSNKYIESFGTGSVKHSKADENALAMCVIEVVQGLMTFGFQSTHAKIKDLMQALVKLLDGRSDVESCDMDAGVDPGGLLTPFIHPMDRFKFSPKSPSVTGLKVSIIKVLMDVADLRANFRLCKLLQRFKEYNSDERLSLELKKHHAFVKENKADMYSGPLTDKIFDDFEELFVKGDGAALDLGKLSGGQNVDQILLDCLMYNDDVLFARALGMLERTYAQRRKLIEAAGDVTLLERENVPVFGNVADMSAELSYLTFLVRSSEVWGVSSRVSGPFGPDKYDTVVRTCDKIAEFLFHPVLKYEKAVVPAKRGSANSGLLAARLATVPGIPNSSDNPMLSNVSAASIDPDEDAGDGPVLFHQDVLRSMNLQLTLIEGLNIDYNISFKGSICSSDDKCKSREMLVHVQRKLFEALGNFVRGNTKNQVVVFKHLKTLRKHLGPLKLPLTWPDDFGVEHQRRLATGPGLNTEEIIIECLRNNANLCENSTPRDLLEEFGALMDQEPDPSGCNQLELFQILCLPNGPGGKAVPRNQEMVLDVLLSDSLTNVKAALDAVFDETSAGVTSSPETILNLLSATICQSNIKAASKLQGKGVRLETTLHRAHSLLVHLTGSHKTAEDAPVMDRVEEEDALAGSAYFVALIAFLAEQLEANVVDPKLFRDPSTWVVITTGVSCLVGACARGQIAHTDEMVAAAAAACRVGSIIINGARQLGLVHIEEKHRDALIASETSVYKSAVTLATSPFFKSERLLRVESTKLANLMQPTTQIVEDFGMETGEFSGDGVELGSVRHGSLSGLRESYHPEKMSKEMTKRVSVLEHGVDLHGADVYQPPVVMRGFFQEALKVNPKLCQKLQARAFELVKLLERAEETTGPAGAAARVVGADGIGACSITWEMLVDRMVRYATDHNYDFNEDDVLRIIRIFKSHLVRARANEDGSENDLDAMSSKEREEYAAKQASFIRLGVGQVALTAIATHAPNVEGNLADQAVDLLLEMLNGGNLLVQTEVINFIKFSDRDNKFLTHIFRRIEASVVSIVERKELVALEFKDMTQDHRVAYENCAQTFLIMQMLCEGHNLDGQDIIRTQPEHSGSVNIVEAATEVLMLLCDSAAALRKMEEAEVKLVCFNLDVLIEALQGPCPGNQEFLADADGFIAALDKIMQSPFHDRVRVAVRLQVKATALKLIASMLESRLDKELKVHSALSRELEPVAFDMLRTYLTKVLKKSEGKVTDGEFEDREDTVLEAMASISTITTELCLVPAYLKKLQSIKKKRKKASMDLFDNAVSTIEVLWKDRIESVSFVCPKDSSFLTHKSKEEFLLSADLSTAEKRMKQLLSAAPVFMAEMKQIYVLSQWSSVYAFIHHNIVNIKWAMYALVVLLNLNIVMASYGEGSTDGYTSIISGFIDGKVEDKYYNSLIVSLVLAVCNILGYVVIVVFLAVTEVPIIIRQMDDYVEECLESISMKESEYRDPGAFTWWTVTLGFNVLFIFMHQFNYPDNKNTDLYSFLVLGINLPWTLSCVRNYVVVPNTYGTRLFCVVYDVLVTKPFFRNHLLLMVCSINGFNDSYYFPLMLMDIMNNSHVLANVARSVTDNIVPLGWVFYLFICTVIIYAQFGLKYFEDWFVYDGEADDEESIGCHSVVSCFFLIFYLGVPAGGLGDVLDNVSNRDQPDYLKRVAFDLSFFVWVGVLLFNIITGLMVDGFGALREEDNVRKDILENSCFVCGFTRVTYDDVPNFKGPSFEFHKNETHDFWNYVNFYVYLKRKEKTDYNGAESYVWDMLSRSDLGWIPNKNSGAIQAANAYVADEGEIDVKKFDQMVEDVEAISEGILKVKEILDEKDSADS